MGITTTDTITTTLSRMGHITQLELAKPHGSRGVWGGSVMLATFAAFVGLAAMLWLMPDNFETVLALGAGLIMAISIVRRPVVGTYIAVVTAILFDALSSAYVQTFISELGVFRNLSYRGLPDGVEVSLFEVMVLLAVGSALAHRFHRRQPLVRGPLFWPMVWFVLMVVIGEAIGLFTGGDFKISLWEMRPLLYPAALYILAVNTISEPRHIRILLWIVVVFIGARCLEAVWRFILMSPEVRATASSVVEHDDSVFLAIPFGLVLLPALWRKWVARWLFPVLLLTLPLVTYTMLINRRRAVYMCVFLVVVVVLQLVWVTLRSRQQRVRLVQFVLAGLVLLTAYMGVFWNRQSGVGAPAQALRSIVDPNERDLSSNLYRLQENENLRYTISLSPIIGVGFGKPMEVVVPMVDLTSEWQMQLYMPHNNMLWLWMRMGILGFVSFWVLIGCSVLLVATCIRLGMSRWRALEVEEGHHAFRSGLAGPRWRWVMYAIGSGQMTRLYSGDHGGGAAHSGANATGTQAADRRPQQERTDRASEVSRLRSDSIYRMKQECAEFMAMIFLSMSSLASFIAVVVLDQGLMSPRLSAYLGVIIGTLAAAWNIYSERWRRGCV
jgi:hypothetical protein